ncbi:MAG TPA: hypothetical protein VKV73_02470, partial [Chloroflexota bacterium]|nr:hypothetical protein [Chloroflexota bacterium]
MVLRIVVTPYRNLTNLMTQTFQSQHEQPNPEERAQRREASAGEGKRAQRTEASAAKGSKCSEDLAGYARVRERLPGPTLASGEHWYGPHPFATAAQRREASAAKGSERSEGKRAQRREASAAKGSERSEGKR